MIIIIIIIIIMCNNIFFLFFGSTARIRDYLLRLRQSNNIKISCVTGIQALRYKSELNILSKAISINFISTKKFVKFRANLVNFAKVLDLNDVFENFSICRNEKHLLFDHTVSLLSFFCLQINHTRMFISISIV